MSRQFRILNLGGSSTMRRHSHSPLNRLGFVRSALSRISAGPGLRSYPPASEYVTGRKYPFDPSGRAAKTRAFKVEVVQDNRVLSEVGCALALGKAKNVGRATWILLGREGKEQPVLDVTRRPSFTFIATDLVLNLAEVAERVEPQLSFQVIDGSVAVV